MIKTLNRGVSAPLAIGAIIVLSLLLVGGIIVWQYQVPSGEEFEKEGKPEMTFSDDCDKLANELESLIEEANYCEQKMDCLIIEHSACELGPFILINKDTDLSDLQRGMAKYMTNCGVCDWAPLSPEQRETIDCIEGRCTLSL